VSLFRGKRRQSVVFETAAWHSPGDVSAFIPIRDNVRGGCGVHVPLEIHFTQDFG